MADIIRLRYNLDLDSLLECNELDYLTAIDLKSALPTILPSVEVVLTVDEFNVVNILSIDDDAAIKNETVELVNGIAELK